MSLPAFVAVVGPKIGEPWLPKRHRPGFGGPGAAFALFLPAPRPIGRHRSPPAVVVFPQLPWLSPSQPQFDPCSSVDLGVLRRCWCRSGSRTPARRRPWLDARLRSSSMKSPGFMPAVARPWRRACASSATSSTSAAWICVLQQVHPAAVGLVGIALHGRIQDVADRLQRRVGDAEVDGAAGVADLQRETRWPPRSRWAWRCWRTAAASPSAGTPAPAGRCRARPFWYSAKITSTRRADDALLGGREIAALDAGVELAAPPKSASITANTSVGSHTIRPCRAAA